MTILSRRDSRAIRASLANRKLGLPLASISSKYVWPDSIMMYRAPSEVARTS